MKKTLLLIAIAIFASVSANAQYSQYKSQAEIKQEAQEKARKEAKATKLAAKETEKSKKDKEPERKVKEVKVPVMKIDAKYAAGSCPLVDGKVQWETTISCPGLKAQQIYERVLAFLDPYCTEKNKDKDSKIAIVNPSQHEIGARIGEYVEFSRSAFSLDRAMMHYTLCVYCFDGKCKVVMKSISYMYEDKYNTAEEWLADDNALNKTQTDFHKGGYEKFRIKTIDAKDTLFQRLSDAINLKK